MGKPKTPLTAWRDPWMLQRGDKLIGLFVCCGGNLAPEQIDNLNHATLGEVYDTLEEQKLTPIGLADVSRAVDFNVVEFMQEIQSRLATGSSIILVAMVAAHDGIIDSSNQTLLGASTNGALYSVCFTPPTQNKVAAVKIKPSGKLVLNGWKVSGTKQTVSLAVHLNDDRFDASRQDGENGFPAGCVTMHVVKVRA